MLFSSSLIRPLFYTSPLINGLFMICAEENTKQVRIKKPAEISGKRKMKIPVGG
jgi:hypothetical protein